MFVTLANYVISDFIKRKIDRQDCMDGPSPRIIKQVSKIMNNPIEGVTSFTPDPQNFRHFFIEIQGPKNSLYEGGKFKLDLQLSTNYPLQKPKLLFKTYIFHQRIDPKEGFICLLILISQWSPVYHIRLILEEVLRLLRLPDEEGHFNAEAAELWRKDKKAAEEKAKECTIKYAK